MENELKPLMIGNFLNKFKKQLTAEQVEYIGNVLLGENDEFSEVLFSAIEDDNLEHVKIIVDNIIE